MTREEARLTLQENLGMLSFMFSRRISEAIKVALEVLSQPSFPSNLDEAAEEFEKHAMEDYDEICVNEDGSESPVLNCDLKDAFKAGAEWMAEQGETVAGTFHHSRGYPSVIELKTYLRDYEGEDVIVQIRKKED